MDNKNILITGGSGFIGRNLIHALLLLDYNITVIDLIRPHWLHHSVNFIEGSFTSIHLLETTIFECDVIYHLASTTLPQSSNIDPVFDIDSNLSGTVKLLEIAVKKGVKKFIFASSGGTVYGIQKSLPIQENALTNPTCSYGIVKLAVEKYLRLFYQLYGLDTCSLRIANPYGEFQRTNRAHGAITVFCKKAIDNETIEIWGDGTIERDFIFIDDVITALIGAMKYSCKGEEINIGSGIATSLNEVISVIESKLNKKLSIKYQQSRDFDVPKTYLDISKAKQILNWSATTSLNEGIDKTLKWIEDDINAVINPK